MQLSTWGFLKKIPVLLWTKCKSSLETLVKHKLFLRVAFDVPTQLEQIVNPCLSNVCKMRPFLNIVKGFFKTYFGLVVAECGNALTFEYPAVTLFGAGGEQKLVSASLSYIFVLEC